MMKEQDNDAVALQRAQLIRQRRLATGLLLIMGLIYLATKLVPEPAYWVLLLRAGAEAAMVGGLADWFAVSALFRHPFGIPVPHTAIIPKNKERIGEGLGTFVERNFLAPELVAARIRSLDPADKMARWLLASGNAELLAGRLVAMLPFILNSLQDKELRELLRRTLSDQIAGIDLAPVLGRILHILKEADQHQLLFDRLLVVARNVLVENEARIYAMVADRSRWWVPETVDRAIANKIITGVIELLGELSQHDHEARRALDRSLAEFLDELQHSEAKREAVQQLKMRLLENAVVQDYMGALWDHLRGMLLQDVNAPASKLRAALVSALLSLGHALGENPSVQARINRRVEKVVMEFIVPWRTEIGRFIADVVRGWDTDTVTQRIELVVGADLQFIRMNGTLVGALVGCLIFLVSDLLFA